MSIRNLAIAAGALLLASCGSSETPTANEPTIDREAIISFMQEKVQPTADIYWGSAGFLSDEDGMHDLSPTTEEGWAATLQSTKDLQAQAELLMSDTYAANRGQDWQDFAQGMLDVAKKAEQTALDRDSDAIFETGGVMYNVCRGCHTAYAPEEPPVSDPNA